MNRFLKLMLGVLFVTSLGVASVGAQAPAISPKVPVGTSFTARLISPLNIAKAPTNTPIEAETTQDLKSGKDVILKKGSTLTGHIESVQTATAEQKETYVVIVFDGARPKKGEPIHLVTIIQALALESDMIKGSLAEPTGSDMVLATSVAGVTGHSSADHGSINQMTTASTGVLDIPGLELSERVINGKHYTVLATPRNELMLKKGTQLVMKTAVE